MISFYSDGSPFGLVSGDVDGDNDMDLVMLWGYLTPPQLLLLK